MVREIPPTETAQSSKKIISRRSFLKTGTVALGTAGLGLPVAATADPDVRIMDAEEPVERETNNDDYTGVDPKHPRYRSLWVNHRGTFEYYGMAPRPSNTGPDKWGHIFRISGRGESVLFEGDKENGGYYPYLSGHGIDINDISDNAKIWKPGEENDKGKLGASPANGGELDTLGRAKATFKALLSETPGVGSLQTLNSLISDLEVDEGAGSDTYGWSLDSIGVIDHQTAPVTDHFVELEVRASPDEFVSMKIDTKTYLSHVLEAESPVGLRGYALLDTPKESVPSDYREAVDYGYDIKLRPSASEKYDTSNGMVLESTDTIDVQDIIVPPGSGTGIDLVALPN